MNQDAIVVFTARSPERIIREGGSQAWVLNPARAKLCTWIVCTQNRNHPNHEFSDATEPHGTAFLVGRISRVRKSEERPERWMIAISEYARVEHPEAWAHWRNPVRYTTLDDLGISFSGLDFKAMPSLGNENPSGAPVETRLTPGITIAEAKKALAETFGVSPEVIEITILG